MRILLINPPNCGKSIPEERYGIDSIKMIFRGEPLCLETLAGNLSGHDVRIIDLKAEPDALSGDQLAVTPESFQSGETSKKIIINIHIEKLPEGIYLATSENGESIPDRRLIQ
jgi:hypothetical protein